LPRQAEADDLTAQMDAQRKALSGVKATVAELADTPAKVEQLTADLEVLGDPRRDYQRAADIADQREVVEGDDSVRRAESPMDRRASAGQQSAL